ncbi:uncharacterized protein [Gossypium hirsutum]|uniref:Uncharacterized protein n=1 Tax=Gossypium hirsutum TaxID=3635 RepID=A0ABM3BJW6_GOSHI|nr:uncharacterized protein LOC121228177 [Gossypium hirsutum]
MRLIDSDFNFLTGDKLLKMHVNNSNSTPVNISCFNLIFVDQGANVDDGSAMTSKPASSKLNLVEVQDLGFIGPSFTWQRGWMKHANKELVSNKWRFSVNEDGESSKAKGKGKVVES